MASELFAWNSKIHAKQQSSKEVLPPPPRSVDHACSPDCYFRSEDTGFLLDSGCLVKLALK